MEINKNAAVEIHLNYNKPKPHKNPKNGQGSLYQGETVEKDDVCFSPGAFASVFCVHLSVLLLNAWISQLLTYAFWRSNRLENTAGVYAVPCAMFE